MTGTTSLLYKGSDGTSRSINPDNYQPKGSYAAANHNHNGIYQPAGSYAAANHSHNGANLSFDSTRSINDAINNNYSMIVSANNEINNLKTSVSSGKTQIASAITDKGVSTAASATFSQMASNIRSINAMPQLLGTWKFNDELFFTTTSAYETREGFITYTFTNSNGVTCAGKILRIGYDSSIGGYTIKCYIETYSYYTIYNSTYANKWFGNSQYITITSVGSVSGVDVYKQVLSLLLPFATKVS